jgi:hypothetical protein
MALIESDTGLLLLLKPPGMGMITAGRTVRFCGGEVE